MLLNVEKERKIYEMEKIDVKKGLKNILISYLKKKERHQEFSKRWLTIIVFFNFHQQTVTDYRALKEQFSQQLKMTAMLYLYTSQYNVYIKSVGDTYNQRLMVNACE